MRAYQCERCFKLLPLDDNSTPYLELKQVGGAGEGVTMDFCKPCSDSFFEWHEALNKQRKKNATKTMAKPVLPKLPKPAKKKAGRKRA